MKKVLIHLLIVLASIVLVICSCTNEPAVHDHTFSQEWVYDDNFHWHSSTCGHDVISGKANHVWDEGIVTKEASHTEDGVRTFSCKTCGYIRTESIPAKTDAHTFSELWSSNETSHWHASSCGHNVISDSANHVWDEGVVTKDPTHYEEGEKTFTCSVCNSTRIEKIPAHSDNHIYSESWTSDDSFHWHASTCGHYVISGKAEHEWNSGVVVKEPTHFEDGVRLYVCTICDKTKVEILPALVEAHIFSEDWTWDNDYHWHVSTCGHDIISDYSEHEWTGWTVTVAPTCLSEGEMTGICAVCGKTTTIAIPIDDAAHAFSEEWIFDDEYHWYSSTCGHDVISSNGVHEWTDWTVTIAQTCLSEGEMEGICAVCGKTTTATIAIDDDAHIFSDDWTADADYHWHVSTCGHDVISGKAEHEWDEGVVVTKGSYTKDWELLFTCTVCGNQKTEIQTPDEYIARFEQYFDVTNDGTLSVKNDVSLPSEVIIPTIVNGKEVRSIGTKAFEARNVSSVTIPSSVTNIGKEAFSSCTCLMDITIPDSVTSIGDSAFYNCTGLTSIIIPSSVTYIGQWVFEKCICDFIFAEGTTVIPVRALAGSDTTSVTIPDSVLKIGDSAFNSCSELTSITIPNSVTSIGQWAFENCTNLTSITIPESVTSIGQYAFHNCPCAVKFADGMTSIPSDALFYASMITSVTMPDSVTSIGDYAFRGCTSLTSITIPKSVSKIGNGAFSDGPRTVIFAEGTTAIPEDALSGASSVVTINMPNSVTSIGSCAFAVCTGLSSITIPDSVVTIGDYAFVDCNNLSNIVFNGTMSQWDSISVNYKWNNNVPATTVHCTDGDTHIIPNGHSFSDEWTYDADYHWHVATCEHVDLISGKTEHEWDDGVVTKAVTHTEDGELTYTCTVCGTTKTESIPALIDAHTFSEEWSSDTETHWHNATCVHIELRIDESVHSWDDGTITKKPTCTEAGEKTYTCTICGKTITVTVPSLGGHSYTSEWTERVVDGITYRYRSCGACGHEVSYSSLFSGEEYFDITNDGILTVKQNISVSFPSIVEIPSEINGITVTGIGDRAFAVYSELNPFPCIEITSISLPQSVTSIGEEAFAYCSNLVDLVLPASVTEIKRFGLGGTALTRINIPAALTGIDSSSFEGLLNLEYIDVSEDNPSFCSVDGCLYSKDKKTLIKVPCGVSHDTFGTFIIPSTVISIGSAAFDGCRISGVSIPNTVVSIGSSAFRNCNIQEVVIPESVIYINSDAFSCSDIRNVTIGPSVKYIYARAFDNCQNLTEITIPDSVIYLGENAFSCCLALKTATIGSSVKNIGSFLFGNCESLKSIKFNGSVEDWEKTGVTYGWAAPVSFIECSDGYVGCYSGYNGNTRQPYCIFDEEGNLLKMTEYPNWVAYDSTMESFYATDEAHAEAIEVRFSMNEDSITANISGIDSYSWLERTFSIEKISGTVLMR